LARRIESHLIGGPEGGLEAILEEPEDGPPARASLVCHPHPLYGGTMHNKVVYRVARGLRRSGAVVLRFNFRGVGRSQGAHAHGEGEIEDARAALDWLRGRYPDLPFELAGFSFGSRVITRLGCLRDRAKTPIRLIAVGFPTRSMDMGFLDTCPVEKIFIQSTHDEHGPKVELEKLFGKFAEPKRLIWIQARDHFFDGGLDALEQAVFSLTPAAV
jgi:alpha/beta superfamily hydrolase